MSVKQYQSKLNNLDKDIADLEKKRAEEDKKAAVNRLKLQLANQLLKLL